MTDDVALLNQQLTQKTNQLNLLFSIGQMAACLEDVEDLLCRVVEAAVQLTRADAGSFMIVQRDTDELFLKAVQRLGESQAEKLTLKVSDVVAEMVVETGQPLLVDDTMTRESRLALPPGHPARSLLMVPLKAGDKVIGVLSVENQMSDRAFTNNDLCLISAVADTAALAMQNEWLRQENRRLLFTDVLTGVFNRRFFYEEVEREIARALRYGTLLSLIMFEVDNFADFTRAHGFRAGDNLLRELAQLLTHLTRRVDVVIRYGDEQFAVVLPETAQKGAVIIADRIRQAVAERHFLSQEAGLDGHITVSAGVVTYSEKIKTLDDLVRAVYEALERAKEAGQNRITSWTSEGL